MTDTILGDVHLGRKFVTGVPLHRRGEREESQFRDLKASLYTPGGDHICLGDLFDSFTVPNSVVLRAASLYNRAAIEMPHRKFFILEGNHDVSKDSSKASSFDIFTQLVKFQVNIRVVRNSGVINGRRAFFPYNAFKTALDVVQGVSEEYDVAYGHWDVADFGGDNVVPVDALKCDLIVTGHVHKADAFTRHGKRIIVHGSMQAYAHGEGPGYVTVALDELEGLDTKDLNVRLILGEGEVPPVDLDCLSLTFLRKAPEDVLEDGPAPEYENLDIKSLVSEAIPESIREELMEVYGQ